MTRSEQIASAIEWATAAVIAAGLWAVILWAIWTAYGATAS